MLAEVKESLRYHQEVPIIHIGNDRPNIKYVVAKFQHAVSSFQDLDFLVNNFTKTIVYFDNRQHPEEARRHLQEILDNESDRQQIGCYHSLKSDEFKKEALQEFKDGKLRVLLATEALGMGMDISDVTLVIQYGLPKNISALVQRLGRAARDPSLEALEIDMTNPEAFDGAENKAASKRAPRLTAQDKEDARQAIDKWRTIVFKRDYLDPSGAFSLYSEQAVISDKQRENLVSKCAKLFGGFDPHPHGP
ncbi:hypothetical protein BGZ70_003541 [Mortierella alpina]|uniref:DNA 3'-5' helicase n=1 Tax=Mortierella alpina TaxID=64518 RepID=A0A9P6IS47_MORAP|nr:hypothetical protein BGZ70_003541 [Mortierella alpina]